jgi:polyhydroxyalkanoate synthesis regulator phasin
MNQTLKSVLYQSLGVIAISKDKIEKAIDEFVAQGKLTREEGRKFAGEIQEEAMKTSEKFKQTGKETVREWLEESGIPTRAEFDALKSRLEALENQISSRESV